MHACLKTSPDRIDTDILGAEYKLIFKWFIPVIGGNPMKRRLGSGAVISFLKGSGAEVLVIGGSLEAEIADLADIADRLEFLRDAGLEEPGVNRLVHSAYRLLKLRTFFTVGPKEIRAWTIREGMTAPQAAGAIHSDLERGFIRAEVMKYNDFISYGSEHACREAGRFFVEGKNYIVDDGDILHIRFNV